MIDKLFSIDLGLLSCHNLHNFFFFLHHDFLNLSLKIFLKTLIRMLNTLYPKYKLQVTTTRMVSKGKGKKDWNRPFVLMMNKAEFDSLDGGDGVIVGSSQSEIMVPNFAPITPPKQKNTPLSSCYLKAHPIPNYPPKYQLNHMDLQYYEYYLKQYQCISLSVFNSLLIAIETMYYEDGYIQRQGLRNLFPIRTLNKFMREVQVDQAIKNVCLYWQNKHRVFQFPYVRDLWKKNSNHPFQPRQFTRGSYKNKYSPSNAPIILKEIRKDLEKFKRILAKMYQHQVSQIGSFNLQFNYFKKKCEQILQQKYRKNINEMDEQKKAELRKCSQKSRKKIINEQIHDSDKKASIKLKLEQEKQEKQKILKKEVDEQIASKEHKKCPIREKLHTVMKLLKMVSSKYPEEVKHSDFWIKINKMEKNRRSS